MLFGKRAYSACLVGAFGQLGEQFEILLLIQQHAGANAINVIAGVGPVDASRNAWSPEALLKAKAMRISDEVEAFSSTVTELNAASATFLILPKFRSVFLDAPFFTMALMTWR
mgnify:CR=1 FL=1